MSDKIEKKLLITGCGRSGTLYSARLFSELGMDIMHELDRHSSELKGKDGFASWFMVVDDPSPPQGPSSQDYQFQYVLHQVRHPLAVIASFAQFILQKGSRSPEFIEKYIPDFKKGLENTDLTVKQKLVLQAARYWYEWNVLALHKATDTIRLESMAQELPRLCDALGIDYDAEVLIKISPRTNDRRFYVDDDPWVVSWEELKQLDPDLTDKIRTLAESFGYQV